MEIIINGVIIIWTEKKMKEGTVFLRGIPIYLLLREMMQEVAARVIDADVSVLAGNAVYAFPV